MTLRDDILRLLDEEPRTSGELAVALDIAHNYARAKLSVMRKTKPRQIRIVEWRREMVGTRIYPRAVYGLGRGKDAKKPEPMTRTEHNARYRQRCRRAVSSVFQLGRAIDKCRVPVDWRTL